jgi:hypothetical protein
MKATAGIGASKLVIKGVLQQLFLLHRNIIEMKSHKEMKI